MSRLRKITVHRSLYVLVTTCLRVVTNSYEYLRVLTIFWQKVYKSCKSQCIIIRELTSRETTWHMRETDCSYINDFHNSFFNEPRGKGKRPSSYTRYSSTEGFGAGPGWPAGPSLDNMIISCMSWTEKTLLATRTFSELMPTVKKYLRVVYDTYGLLRVTYGKNQSVDDRKKIFDM